MIIYKVLNWYKKSNILVYLCVFNVIVIDVGIVYVLNDSWIYGIWILY